MVAEAVVIWAVDLLPRVQKRLVFGFGLTEVAGLQQKIHRGPLHLLPKKLKPALRILDDILVQVRDDAET